MRLISYASVGLDKYPEYKSEKYDAVNIQSKVSYSIKIILVIYE
jgi:hypothetical protein